MARLGRAWLGMARLGRAGQARHGKAWLGRAGLGMARQAWFNNVSLQELME